jgi:hypothetical protein
MKEPKYTAEVERILTRWPQRGYGPQELGLEILESNPNPSSAVMPALKHLEAEKMVEKVGKGPRTVYRWLN